MINNRIRHAADEQRCYQVALKTFAQPLLSPQDATALVQFAKDQGTGTGGECRYGNDIDWPFKPAETSAANLIAIQNKLGILSTSTGYSAWAATSTSPNQMAFAAMSTQTSNLLAEVTGYITGASCTNTNIGQSNSDYKTLVDTNRVWRQRLSKIAGYDTSHSKDPGRAALTAVLVFPPCQEWYGRGRTDSIGLQYTDVSVTSSTAQTLALGSNTCNPLSIASTGIGISLLSSPSYGFVPGDSTGAQVVGKTATNDASPLLVALYNVKLIPLGRSSGVELFISPGVGFTSAANTATTDFLGGLSLSFARRLIFVTGSADFGRRDDLAPGFAVGTPKGSLTSVPTVSTWKPGAMVSISFGIGPS